MKATTKVTLVSGIALVLAITMIASTVVQAADEQITEQTATRLVNAGESSAFRFRHMSRNSVRLEFSTNQSLSIHMDVDAASIGDKEVSIGLNGSGPMTLNMTCRENQAELGLMAGNVVQTRARNRYQYNYGFMANISVNATQLRARLAARVGNVAGYTWAYWDAGTEEWVEVPTNLVDGQAVAEVEHFSTWTLLAPEATIGLDATWLVVLASGAGCLAWIAKSRRKW